MNTKTTVLALINPGQGVAPPGSAGFLLIAQWLAWGVFFVAVCALLYAAGKLMINGRRGDGAEDAGALVKVLVGAVIAGSASGIVGLVLVN